MMRKWFPSKSSLKKNLRKMNLRLWISQRKKVLVALILSYNIFLVLVLLFLFRPTTINADQRDVAIKLAAQAAVRQCANSDGWRDCYGKNLRELIKTEEIEFVLNVLDVAQNSDGKLRDCHIASHRIMDGAVEKNLGEWEELLDAVDPSACNYGFIHGIIDRYESLVADPEPVLRELCDFLEEEFHPAMLAPSEVRDVVPEKKVWHENLKQSVNTDRVESWRKGLEPWELGLMETVLRRKLVRNGYQISGAGERPSPKLVAKYAKDAFERRSSMRKRWAEERKEAASATYPVAAQLTSRQLELAAAGDGQRLP